MSAPAYAYIDPGSGTVLWQALVAAGIGMAFFFHQIANWVKGLFRGRKSGGDD